MFDEADQARAFLADFETGASVTVYSMPDDPGTSYLVEPDYHPLTFLVPVGFGLVFAGPGVLILLWVHGVIGSFGDDAVTASGG